MIHNVVNRCVPAAAFLFGTPLHLGQHASLTRTFLGLCIRRVVWPHPLDPTLEK